MERRRPAEEGLVQGPTENALMLVAAGNAFMAGRDMSGFWPDAPSFKFLKLCEFRLPPASGNDADEYPLVASDPMEFFSLQNPNCRGYRLHHTIRKRGPNQQSDTPDRMLAAFVGGGPRFLIEAVGQFNSELWEGFHRLGDRNDPERRIWLCTHIMQGMVPVKDAQPVGLAEALSDLRIALPEIEAYAREEKHDNFADCFARAREALEGKPDTDLEWVENLVRYTGFDERQLGVLQAINHAWVFGGMGSWNDTGGGERYDEVSERLYNALNDCIAGLANSTYRA
jgi:hypothetical protein